MDFVHIHDVLDLLAQNINKFTPVTFTDTLEKTFGEEVEFESCKFQGIKTSEVLDFLLERNKIYIEEGIIKLNTAIERCG